MAVANAKTTYTDTKVAVLESTIHPQQGQIEAQQAQIKELKHKPDHMKSLQAPHR